MKQALVVASFGTRIPEARRSIDAVEQALREAAAGCTMIRAFTSPTIRRILGEQGEVVPSLTEALEQLRRDGARRVVVQPTHLLYGYEYDKLNAEAEAFADRFAAVAVGKPLLAEQEDILRFAGQVAQTHPRQRGTAVLYMGHGTRHVAHAVYAALQAALDQRGRRDIRIGTVEGRPGVEEVLSQLEPSCAVKLLPLMLVAGDHARTDMAVVWRKALEAARHSVQCEFTGLGEYPWVQAMYRERLLELL